MGGEYVTGIRVMCMLPFASLTKLTYFLLKRRFTYSVNGCIAKFKSSVDAAAALPIFYAAKGADATQISALDLSLFGNVRVDYFDDGKHVIISGFRLVSRTIQDAFRDAGTEALRQWMDGRYRPR